MRKRSRQYDQPHTLYVLADARTAEIRYAGRTIIDPAARFRQHLGAAKESAEQAVHRWLWRLGRLGVPPIFCVVDDNVDHQVENTLCEGLVSLGHRLLNTYPGFSRHNGRVLIEVEQMNGECYVDLVHFGHVFRTSDVLNAQLEGVTAAMRTLADVLEKTDHGSHRFGSAFHFALERTEFVWGGRDQLPFSVMNVSAPNSRKLSSSQREGRLLARRAIRKVESVVRRGRDAAQPAVVADGPSRRR